MMYSKTFEPYASIKLNAYHSLLIVNCNLPRCPERLIKLDVGEEMITIATPEFSKHYLLSLAIPASCKVLTDTVKQEMKGYLFTATWKVEFKSKPSEKNEKEYDGEKEEDEYQAPQTHIPLVVHPRIIQKQERARFEEKNTKAPILSNYVTKKLHSEQEVLEKIADKAIEKTTTKLHEKEQKLQKELEVFEAQEKARKARREAKRMKKGSHEKAEKKGK